MVIVERKCGTCEVCCIEPAIDHPDLIKPAGVICPHLDQSSLTHKCTIYKNRPKEWCGTFFCSWMLGAGSEEDQPCFNNILTYINTLNNGTWVIVIEVTADALTTTGKKMVIELVEKNETAIIVKLFNSSIDTGDWTVIKNSIKHRAKAMIGDFIDWLDEEETMGIYVLNNPLAKNK